MIKSQGIICLIYYFWIAYIVEGYISLTTHFVDENWKLNSKILAFCKIKPPHTEIKLAGKIYTCLKE